VTDEADHTHYINLVSSTDMVHQLLAIARERCDIVVVDTPPGLGPVVQRVLAASDRAIVPLQSEPLALQTTPQILRGIQEIIATNEGLTLDGILLTMHDPSNPASERIAQYVRSHLPANMLFDLSIPRTVAAVDAFAAGQPVVLRTPSDAAAQAYVNLATILAERLR
jgi:chromosome partitioning protein